jgi:hypothetical protein
VAEKPSFFLGGSGWKTCVPHRCWLVSSMSLHYIGCECLAIWGCCGGLHPVM